LFSVYVEREKLSERKNFTSDDEIEHAFADWSALQLLSSILTFFLDLMPVTFFILSRYELLPKSD